jgi:hypothetical protein
MTTCKCCGARLFDPPTGLATHHASPYGILTVGALREMLEGVDPAVHVVMDGEGWYHHVDVVIVPAPVEPEDFQCVTLVPGEPFDARQI